MMGGEIDFAECVPLFDGNEIVLLNGDPAKTHFAKNALLPKAEHAPFHQKHLCRYEVLLKGRGIVPYEGKITAFKN